MSNLILIVLFSKLRRAMRVRKATMPEATQPVRCVFRVKTGAFYGQEAYLTRNSAFWGTMEEWSREILRSFTLEILEVRF